jgi:hypothetical protein
MGSSIRSQLWQGDEDTTKALVRYLLQREVGEEDPVLVMAYTDDFETVRTRTLSSDQNSSKLIASRLTIAARKQPEQ